MRAMKLRDTSWAKARTLNLFWLSGNWFGEQDCRPGWSGFMEKYSAAELFQTTAVLPLPFVNLAPTNPSTIYTSLRFAAEEGKKYGQLCTMVTFDQPLYVKAREMIASADHDSPLKSLFIRLGGFHLLLSFLGCVGHIMAGSGLEDLWSLAYAKNSIIQMMNGKAYARAIRALYLTEEALITVFLEVQSSPSNKEELKTAYRSLVNNGIPHDEILNSAVITSFVAKLEDLLKSGEERGRTQKLWIQFIEMVEIIRLFVRAERTGDFFLHLFCVRRMLPFFHACGHLNYAKSAHLYLQDCLQLPTTLSKEEFEKYVTRGNFTIRRSDKFWSGIWSDMAIEQVLMRSMKTSGGLTRGRGISPSTIATWVKSMPACSRIVEALEAFAGIEGKTSEQHVEL